MPVSPWLRVWVKAMVTTATPASARPAPTASSSARRRPRLTRPAAANGSAKPARQSAASASLDSSSWGWAIAGAGSGTNEPLPAHTATTAAPGGRAAQARGPRVRGGDAEPQRGTQQHLDRGPRPAPQGESVGGEAAD